MLCHICDCLVEGFSVPQCSAVGRAMMGIDFQHIQQTLEKICFMKIPLIANRYVDTYIKAYYQAPEELETWLKEHTEYSHKQASALVNCAPWTVDVKRKCLRFLGPAPTK